MTRIFSALIAVSLFFLGANAQNVYLKFDPACMDRLEYTSGDATSAYISYSLKLGDKTFMTLDIGKEMISQARNLPGPLVSCAGMRFDQELARQINAGTVKLHIVQETQSQFFVTAVEKAAFFAPQGNAIRFLMEDADFILDPDNLVTQVNLAVPNSPKEIYFAGATRMQCLTAFKVQKKDAFSAASFKEYVFSPEMGILERSSGSASTSIDGEAARTAILRLNKAAGMSLDNAIAAICIRKQATYYDGGTTPSTTTKTPDAVTEYSNTDPCAPSTTGGIHTVQKGETMFGISRRYGISLEQLRAWNNLRTDLIAVCQKLFVKDPATVPSASTAATTASTTTSTTGTGTTFTEKSGDGFWMNAPEVHTVRPGETLAGLANLFGYTEDRFRKMNGLGPNENIRLGQQLRTSDCVCPTLQSTTAGTALPYEAETAKITPESKTDVYFRPVRIHQVEREETLFSIAKRYDTTVERILELNGMKQGDKISPSQRIYVQ